MDGRAGLVNCTDSEIDELRNPNDDFMSQDIEVMRDDLIEGLERRHFNDTNIRDVIWNRVIGICKTVQL